MKPSDVLKLEEAGGGGFDARCGFQQVGRVTYRDTPLVYYEKVLEGISV